jgi:GxxExxY protein
MKNHPSGPVRDSGALRETHSLDDITGSIVDAALQIHKDLGPGLLESVYESVLAKALARRGLRVERQKPVTFNYDGMTFEDGFRVDLLVESQVVVELKSVENLAPVHSKQLLTYLRLLNLPVGLLINFGAGTLKEGLHRIVNRLPASASPQLRVNSPIRNANEREFSRGGAESAEGKDPRLSAVPNSAPPRLRVTPPTP